MTSIVPGIIVFWLLFVFNCRNENLFGILLVSAAVTSFLPVLLLLTSITLIPGPVIQLFLMVMLSTVTAVALHQPAVKNILTAQTKILKPKDSESLET